MPRCIDADSLYHRVKTHTNPYGKPTLDYKSGVKVLEMINQEPTADVVPKSEVDRVYYNLQAVLEERAETKQEVAREIFEEIERLMENNEVYFRQTDEMQEEFAELKKKYTEDKE